jgi:hypothetical protein
MNRFIIIFLLFLGVGTASHAQYFEVGPQIGGMIYTGDLDPKQFGQNYQNLRFTGGLFLKYNHNDYFNLRLNVAHGQIQGRDNLADQDWQLRRNLSFKSNITELSLLIENNIFGFSTNAAKDKIFTVHAFAGIGVFRFNPTTVYEGQRVELQPLGTEGQGLPGFEEKYSLTQISIPLGVGIKFRLSERLSLGMEISSRFLFTDYLDDIGGNYVAYEELIAGNGELAASLAKREAEYTGIDTPYQEATGDKRGSSDVNDYFSTGTVTFSYHFNGSKILGGPSKTRCPSF